MKKIILLTVFLLVAVIGSIALRPPTQLDRAKSLFPDFNKTQVTKVPEVMVPKDCSGQVLPEITEGPYYKEGSPERTNIAEGVVGEKFVLKGYVFDKNCHPIVHAAIDFWQANSHGEYDNTGYTLRGHQFTNGEGQFSLETIIPGEYTGRTPHIHAKVKAREGAKIITTQLYLPTNSEKNGKDPIYSPLTLIRIENTDKGKIGFYNFIVD